VAAMGATASSELSGTVSSLSSLMLNPAERTTTTTTQQSDHQNSSSSSSSQSAPSSAAADDDDIEIDSEIGGE
jgi:hypothetical protein